MSVLLFPPPRKAGKSQAATLYREALLNAGKSVLVCNPSGVLLYKRYGHLTSITPKGKW